MSELPPGWEWTTIGDLTLSVSKVDPRSEPDHEFDYIDIGGVDGDHGEILEAQRLAGRAAPSRARQLVRAGDTVLSTVRTYMRKTALVPPRLDGQIASTGFSVLRPAEGVHPKYLYHAVRRQEFVDTLSSLQSGSSYPAVRDKDVRSMPVPLAPKAEQKRIVAAIEEHLSRLNAAESAVESAQRRVAAFDRTILARAQGEGAESYVGELLDDIEAGKSFKTPGRKAEADEWGVIKVSAMTWGEFDEHENKAVPHGQPIDPRYEIRSGDLLLSRANTSEYVGATVLVGPCRPKLLLSDKSMRLVPTSGVDRRWLRFALASPQLRSQMSLLATGTSDSMRNISQAKVRSLRIRVPSDDRQADLADEIEGALRSRGRLEVDLRSAHTRAEGLRRSILAAAFSGHLVPQDPEDEPASVLLERIRAERAAATPTKRTRKVKAS